MSYHSKTFRLFISSTFSDFQAERETLQTKVFPEIKEYCSSKGYVFQPIDLRWGVSNEAQLDQKTLAMCIKEVQSCKIHHYPNFLIMLGDRYGWLPLPNIIEKDEFEQIIQSLDIEEKEYLSEWYYEDANQIPISFILKQRTEEYRDYDKWLEIESKLRKILQIAVSNSDNSFKKKYFTSATEAEAIEGIISYSEKSEFQQKLIQLIPDLEQIDHKHIFGCFRSLDKNTAINNKFVSDDYEKAQAFKERVQKLLIDENILSVNTSQISENKLDESYLEKFTLSVLDFFKKQVDTQIQKDEEKNYSTLVIEKQQQYNYLNQKLENFLGQEETLKKIENYLNGDNKKPLIICGQSGIGKSSIMAKAIEDTSNTTDKKIIYRFVGATPNSTTTKNILTSILEELNITIKDEQVENNNQFLTDIDKEENSFVNFSHKVYDEIMRIKDDIVIFIDAVDQLSNDDQFLWLPNQLPSNIKIVISALKDNCYEDDSKYFYTLEDKISNFIEIEPFYKPIELLEKLLKLQKRILQDEQKEYFLIQYQQVNTPLYVYMAANEMQYWKSSNKAGNDVTLSLSQKDIVKSFIENLTTIHHHDKLLVQKVFGYILASKDGLSEYEILEFLNTDKDFIKKLAPDTWHLNTTQELPLVIWSRLYNHIKPFLSRKNQDGQELLYFFHREFIDVIENQSSQQDEYENIIKAAQKLIEINQDKEFDNNRWGKLYVKLLGEYFFKYKQEDKILELNIQFFKILEENYLNKLIEYAKKTGDILDTNNDLFTAFSYRKISNILLKILQNISNNFIYQYRLSLHETANVLIKLECYEDVLNIENENLTFMENSLLYKRLLKLYKLKDRFKINLLNTISHASIDWIILFIKTREIISICHIENNNIKKSITIDEKNLKIIDFIYKKLNNLKIWEKYYIQSVNKLVISIYQNSQHMKGHIYVDLSNKGFDFTRAISMQNNALKIIDSNLASQTNYLIEEYSDALYNLAVIENKSVNHSIELLHKSSEIINQLITLNPNRYYKKLLKINSKIIELSQGMNSILQTESIYIENIKVLNKVGKNEIAELIQNWSKELDIQFYHTKNKKQQLELFLLNKKIIEYVFNLEKQYWAKTYVKRLIALGSLLSKSKIDGVQLSMAESIQKESVDTCEKFMSDDDEWYDLYTININNLANTYLYLNKNDESSQLNIKNLTISRKLFQKDEQKWFRAYYYALESMASTYFYNGEDDKEQECRDKIEELESHPSYQFIEDVINSKSEKKKIRYFDYFYKALLLLGVYFFIKYVFLE